MASDESPLPSVEESVKKSLRLIVWSVIAMYLIVGALATYNWHQANSVDARLCSFTEDLYQRIERGEEFLALSIPERVERYGAHLGRIDETVIQNQINQQSMTLESLGGRC